MTKECARLRAKRAASSQDNQIRHQLHTLRKGKTHAAQRKATQIHDASGQTNRCFDRDPAFHVAMHSERPGTEAALQ